MIIVKKFVGEFPHQTGEIAEGKTKKIYASTDEGYGFFISKNDLTAENGKKHDILQGKGALANQTTSSVFRLLNDAGIPTSFIKKFDETSFFGEICDMIPYEVVVRREAHGSFLKGYPNISLGDTFQTLVVQFFLKTSNNNWKGNVLPCDDPLIIIQDGFGCLYNPDLPIAGQEPFAILEDFPLKGNPETIQQIINIAKKAFLVLEKAWQVASCNWWRLVDFKVEFGRNYDKKLVLSDVIDSDSWRVKDPNGLDLSKQSYRNGASLEVVLAQYQLAADFTSRFAIPTQKIIIWKGSAKDDSSFIKNFILNTLEERDYVEIVECSMHKQPVKGVKKIVELTQRFPGSVIIALVGMSNGAGPILSTQSASTVINVPASVKDFPDDIYSSLRLPSNVPALTVMNGENAALAALKILAMSNPYIYMRTRFDQEKLIS
jgi:phosphoribosylaminoimidazole carboxylase/phosphoribosylaminoimidazole-succinocarboxamide synthase